MAQRLNEKLAEALPWHYRQARPFREKRREVLRDHAGRTTYPAYENILYGEQAEKQIVNLTMQSAEAFVMNLAANRPRFSVKSRYVQYDAFAERMARGLDRYAEELYLEEVLQEIVRDSFSSVGAAKVYQASSAAVGVETDYRMDRGRPYVQRIGLDRLVWDTAAASETDVQLIGDFYSMPLRQALRSPRFSRSAREKIRDVGAEDWQTDGDRGEDLAKSQNNCPIDDVIFLVDVFLRLPITIGGRKYKSHIRTYVCTRALELRIPDPVQVLGWDGEECGPYVFLNMGPVPDHFMPSSPGQNQRLLVQLANTLYRKLEEQARRQKIVTYAEKGDAEVLRDARDGEFIELLNPQAVNQIRLDGPDQNIFGMLLNTLEQHSQAAGNLKSKLGLGPSADTASQDKMIGEMVSKFEAFYQQRYVSFVRRVAKNLARLIFYDADLVIPGKYETPGGYVVDDDFLPYGTFDDDGVPSRPDGEYSAICRVDIDPYAMGYKSPGERAAMYDAEVQTFLPAAPMLAQMGVQLDLAAYFQEKAKLLGEPGLTKIFKTSQPPLEVQGAGGGGMGSMGGPNGQYEHTSRSTRSPQSEAMQMFQAPQGSAA